MSQKSEADALIIRRHIIKMLELAGSGHAGGALGIADILAVLYREILRHDPQNPTWENRDRFVLSNGHTCPALYATLALHNYFPKDELWQLRQINSFLEGHPHENVEKGIELSSGPLGQGLSQMLGMSLAGRLKQLDNHFFALLSDGEHQEGQTWEAYQFGAKYKLANATVIIDRNYIQISGVTEQIMPLDPFADKIRSFGWQVYEVNGHDHQAIYQTIREAMTDEQPSAIIAYTTPGKGVDFIEAKFTWHGDAPDPQQARTALRQLNSLAGKLDTQYD